MNNDANNDANSDVHAHARMGAAKGAPDGELYAQLQHESKRACNGAATDSGAKGCGSSTDKATSDDDIDNDNESEKEWQPKLDVEDEARASAMQMGGLTYRTTLLQSLALMEGTMGWVSGCAWCDAVLATPLFPNLTEFPTALTCVTYLVSSLLLTALAIAWLVATGSTDSIDEQHRKNRDHIEKFYLTNGMSYVVGYGWVLFVRAMRAELRLALVLSPLWELASEISIVVFFGPLLIVSILKVKEYSMAAFARSTGMDRSGKLRHMLLSAVVADGSELNPRTFRRLRAERLKPLLQSAKRSVRAPVAPAWPRAYCRSSIPMC